MSDDATTVLIEDIPRLLAGPATALAKLRRDVLDACDVPVCGECGQSEPPTDAEVIREVKWLARKLSEAIHAQRDIRENLSKLNEENAKLELEAGRRELYVQQLEKKLEAKVVREILDGK